VNDLTSVEALRQARVIAMVVGSWRPIGPDTARNAEERPPSPIRFTLLRKRPSISHQWRRMRWCSPALLNIAMMCEIAEGPVGSEDIDGALTAYFLRIMN
jgi:hypothetical protein